jgi:anaerobic selenocysteine-containing dehydrogenase
MYHHLPALQARVPTNCAYLHPDDLDALGIEDGDVVTITSSHGRIEAPARGDPDMRPGVVSMAHGWGGLPGDEAREPGVNSNLLTSSLVGRDPINAMPVMTGFPVQVEPRAGK